LKKSEVEFVWKYDAVKKKIIGVRKPECFTEAIWGLGKDLLQESGGDEFI
jgi:hypothetical protein